jgi:endonuclease/exonuclease/phosphatase family metal-dependent hydrolase
MKRYYSGLLFGLIFNGSIALQAQAGTRGDLCFVWYNVENLFYPDSDSLPADNEFTPEGVRHWTWSRYRDKLTSLAKVIVASGRGEPPEVVGLCEVENALVLEDLTTHPILAPYHYGYLHREGTDHRGMEVSCLFRTGSIDTVQWETIPFSPPVFATRDMMHISLRSGGDTLDLFLVHLLSKYGGAGATAQLRRIQAEQLVHCMDSVYANRCGGSIIAAGDFNDEYEGYSMEPLRNARFGGDSLTPLHLHGGRGTYKYRGNWSQIDQVLATQSLMPYAVNVTTLELPPLMIEDQEYGGLKPKRTYEGFLYSGGVSDHLPLVIDLTFSPFSAPAVR